MRYSNSSNGYLILIFYLFVYLFYLEKQNCWHPFNYLNAQLSSLGFCASHAFS